MKEKARKWLRRAEEDLLALSQLAPIQTPDVVGMLCQQAVEKLLKACWIELGWRIPLTHDLRTLWSDLQMHFDFKIESQRLGDLTPYGTRARYPDFEIDPPDALEAVEFTLETCAKLKLWLESRE